MTDINTKIQLWRQKAREHALTQEELREALAALRNERTMAQKTSTKSRTTKAAKAAVNSDDLLSELEGL